MSAASTVRWLITLALCAGAACATADDATEESHKALLGFITDVSTFEGMYYSVHDYCARYADQPIADQSEKRWRERNAALLADRDAAVQRYVAAIGRHGADPATLDKVRAWQKQIFGKSHDDDRLYHDLAPLPDKYLGCSQRLAEMNTDTMSFERISPASAAYGHTLHTP